MKEKLRIIREMRDLIVCLFLGHAWYIQDEEGFDFCTRCKINKDRFGDISRY